MAIDALADEIGRGHFQDRRLARRAAEMSAAIAHSPEKSLPKLFDSAGLEAAYRFMSNASVTPEVILSGHFEATRYRCAAEPCVLVVHDTTTMTYRDNGERRNLGRLVKSGQSFFAHLSLALSGDGSRLPLGVIGLKTFARGEERPLGQEQQRWFEQAHLAASRLDSSNHVVHIMDREADDFALFSRMLGCDHRFVIRSKSNRLLNASLSNGAKKLDVAIADIECVVERTASVSKRIDGKRAPIQKKIHPARSPRIATLSFGATRVAIQRPEDQPRSLPKHIELNIVRVWERNPPEDQAPIGWTLFTTEPIDTTDAIVAVIEKYRARWVVEEYFKALKTGCDFEAKQLRDYEGLINALAIYCPVAWHLLLLRGKMNQTPEESARTVLDDDHITVLRTLGRRPLPPEPTVRDVVLAIAELGGYIRSKKAAPGWLTIARGYDDLRMMTVGWRLAKLQAAMC